MPSLLDIPPELRECIVQQVLNGHSTPHETPSKANRVNLKDIPWEEWHTKYNAWYSSEHGIYTEKYYASNCISLLLANRQLSAETRAVMIRMKTRYTLDISFFNDMDLFPTWLSIPYIATHIHTLYADVRLFGHIVSDEIACTQAGDGGTLGFHWSFYALLERFVQYGPVGEAKALPIHNWDDVAVELLVLNFSSAEPELLFPPDTVADYRTWQAQHFTAPSSRERRLPQDIHLQRYTTRPEWPVRLLVDKINWLLEMDYNTASYGKILYERFGTIRILVNNGDVMHEFDLAGRLASLRFTHPSSTFGHLREEKRIPAFWNWKKKTLMRRAESGLPVVWPKDPELAETPQVASLLGATGEE